MGRLGDLAVKLAIFGYLAMALYFGWSRDDQLGVPTMILRGALWPVTLFLDYARQGYTPA